MTSNIQVINESAKSVIALKFTVGHSREEYVKLISAYQKDELFEFIQTKKDLVVKKQIKPMQYFPEMINAFLTESENFSSFIPEFNSKKKYVNLKKNFLFVIKFLNTNEDDIVLLQYLVMLRRIIESEEKNKVFFLFDIEENGTSFVHRITSYLLLEFFRGINNFLDCVLVRDFEDYYFRQDIDCGYNHFYQYNSENKPCKRFPLKGVSLSSEWLPIMLFKSRTKDGLDVRILEDDAKGKSEIDLKKYISNDNKFNVLALLKENERKITSFESFIKTVLRAICESIFERFDDLMQRKVLELTDFATEFVKCLFYIAVKQCGVKCDSNYIDELFQQCYDCFELTYQLLENAQYYSESGGLLSIRANDKTDNLPFEFNRNIKNYFRISIMDCSKASILDNIQKQSGIKELTLDNVFGNSESEEYREYLQKENNVIHHYGLSALTSLVAANDGIFWVVSSLHSNVGEDKVCPRERCMKVEKSEADENKEKGESSIGLREGYEKLAHVPGTFYEIVLPILSEKRVKKAVGIASIDFAYRTDELPESIECAFDWNKYFIGKTYFNDGESKMKAVEELSKILYEGRREQNKLLIFDLTKVDMLLSNYEIIAKATMRAIVNYRANRSFAVLVPDKQCLIKLVRQFALFYNKYGCNEYLQDCQIYIRECRQTSAAYVPAEAILAGDSIDSVYESSVAFQLNSGFPAELFHFFEHLGKRNQKKKNVEVGGKRPLVKLIPFEDVIKVNGEFAWLSKLKHVIRTDVHESYLGCRMPNVHVPVSKHAVHLSDFYEAQFLFANAYWSNKFAQFLLNQFVTVKKDSKILLVGYETYSEPLMCRLKAKLIEAGVKKENVHYVIVENKKYVTGKHKAGERLHYEDGIGNILKVNSLSREDVTVMFVVGISVTLSTFRQMYEKLFSSLMQQTKCKEEDIKEYFKKIHVLCCSVLQIVAPPNRKAFQNEIITVIEKEKEVRPTNSNADEPIQTVKYLCSAETEWYNPHSCPLCFPERGTKELPLLQLDETSVIPFQLIESRLYDAAEREEFPRTYHCDFTAREENRAYLSYGHVERGDNHFQYYVRTRDFLAYSFEHDTPNEGIYRWLANIKQSLQIGKESRRTLNIIVTSSHFSNQKLVNKVNECVFGNNAYIIDFNVKKEFRSNFEAKFSNYKDFIRTLNEFVCREAYEEKLPPTIHCYFVDDCIISGETFNRSKDLLKGLFDEYCCLASDEKERQRVEVCLFKGIIVAIDRNSTNSKKFFLEKSEVFEDEEIKNLYPFYSYIELDIPSIRTYGDSCPLCKKISDSKAMLANCQLNDMDYTWREKGFYHRLRTIYDLEENSETTSQIRNFRRLQCENDLWKAMKKARYSGESIETKILDCIRQRVSRTKGEKEKIEYAISYLKVLSRPFLYYREIMKPIALNVLKNCYFLFVEGICDGHEFYRTLAKLIKSPSVETRNSIADLYKLIIVRLCSIYSNFLIDTQEHYGEKLRRAFSKLKELCGEEYSLKDSLVFKYALKVYAMEFSYANRLIENIKALISEDDFFCELYLEIFEKSEREKFLNSVVLGDLPNSDRTQETDKDRIKIFYNAVAEFLRKSIGCNEIAFYVNTTKRTGLGKAEETKDVEILNISTNAVSSTKQTHSGFYREGDGIYWLMIDNNYFDLIDENINPLRYEDYRKYVEEKKDMSLGGTYSLFIRIDTGTQLLSEQLDMVKKVAYCREKLLQRVCEDFNNNAVMLANEYEEKKKALSIEKAMSHPLGQKYYETPYDNWVGLTEEEDDQQKINDAFSRRNPQKRLADKLLLMHANDWLVRLYQAIVLGRLFTLSPSQSTVIDVEREAMGIDKHLIDKLCKDEFEIFIEESALSIHCSGIVCFGENQKAEVVDGHVRPKRDVAIYIPSRDGDEESPNCSRYNYPFLMILILMAENAYKHGNATKISFSIEGEGKIKYLICKNEVQDEVDLGERIRKAKERSETMSERTGDQSITLWTLKRYCESLVKKLNEDAREAFVIEGRGREFVVKLQIIYVED